MKKPRIEAKAKEVEFIRLEDGRFSVKAGIDLSAFAANIDDIKTLITEGKGLPNHYYRKSKGKDYLLADKGWLHLHVGHDSDDNVLLVVEQTEDKVIFIGLTDHSIFDEVPRGKSLARLGSKIAVAKLDTPSAHYRVTRARKT